VITLVYKPSTGEVETLQHFQLDNAEEGHNGVLDLGQARSAIESALEAEINNWLPSRQSRIGLTFSLVGLHH
jgi:hypothetical protein